jgi:hypothetical protein
MSELNNALLLAGDAILYFAVLSALFRARARLGIGAFFCALGVMHFLETTIDGLAMLTRSPHRRERVACLEW